MKISWWDNLEKKLQKSIIKYSEVGIIRQQEKALIPDGNKYCDWGNVDIISNIYLS